MKLFSVFALAGLLAAAAHAQHEALTVNPDASEVKMTLQTTHEVVSGVFHIQSGAIAIDLGTARMSGAVVVAAGSCKTGNGSRDNRMNREILQVEQHAIVSFEPKSYTGAIAPSGDSTIQVTGIFTLLGTAHEIVIPMLVHIEGTGATAKAHFVVPYVQWGVKDPSFFVWKADKDVAIDILISGRLTK
jgi:polyisoprenoid-binding protein YceI